MIRRATRADAESLARLHAASLPASLLSALGHAALVRYYRFVAASPHERAWVAEEAGAVVGGCVLSDAPQTVLARFARHAPLPLARELAASVLRNGTLRRRLLRGVREEREQPHVPELTQIFTDPHRRGQGIGAGLLRACDADLRARGTARYFVHTQRDDNDAGIRFYGREGFVRIGESRSFGDVFLVMQKDLD